MTSETLLAQAASGSREAQAALVDVCILDDNTDRPRQIERLTGAELFARMAAQHGKVGDIRRLAAVLMMRAGYEREHGSIDLAAVLDAEALTLLDIAIDEGDQTALQAMGEAAAVLPAAPFRVLAMMRGQAE